VVEAEVLAQDREDGQVDQVARAADEAELDQLHPVGGLSRPGADPARERDRAGGGQAALVEASIGLFDWHRNQAARAT
jgi:hypothetical protein